MSQSQNVEKNNHQVQVREKRVKLGVCSNYHQITSMSTNMSLCP